MVRSTFAYLFAALYATIMTPIAIGLSLLFRNTHIVYMLARFCIRVAGIIAGVRVRTFGRDLLAHGETYVVLSNHQSNCDAPILAHALPRDYRALMKQEVMRMPVMSFIFHHVQFVGIDRKDPRNARSGVDRAAELIRGGLTFIAFPEGTRSRDGKLGEFKKGVFMMAMKSGKPILPVTIRNSREVQPPGRYRIRPGTVDVLFHPPIPTEGFSMDQRDEIAARTRAAIESGLGQRQSHPHVGAPPDPGKALSEGTP